MRQLILALTLTAAPTALAAPFQVTSADVKEGKPLASAQVYSGFGCTGGNLSPQLAWENAPAGTKSFAVTIYDPDAPTGSGWWHWLVYDIPASAKGLPGAVGSKGALPAGAQQGKNDFGAKEFDGACPPQGDKPHHYNITVFALKVDKLGVPAEASAAFIGFNLNANSLGKATLTATYGR